MKGIVCFLVILMGMIVSCEKSEYEKTIVGNWRDSSDPYNDVCTWTFEKNGELLIDCLYGDEVIKRRWRYNEGKLVINEGFNKKIAEYRVNSINDAEMRLYNSVSGVTKVLDRVN